MKSTTGKVGVIVLLCKTSICIQDHYYLTFYRLLPSLSTHKSDPVLPAKSYQCLELKGVMSMNSKDLEETGGATVNVMWTFEFAQMISIY